MNEPRTAAVENPNPAPGRVVGLAAIALGLAFNVPYAILALQFDYPQVLRRPAAEVLAQFAAGGPGLVLVWHAFALTAVALAPVAVALAITPGRLARRPALAIGAAIAGGLSSLAQAVGLLRWVFVVPALAGAAASAPGGADAQAGFELLHAFAGVAIGEHLGQLLLALFVVQMGVLQWVEGRRRTGALAVATAVVLAFGSWEGVMSSLGRSGDANAMATIVGFLALTAWLLVTGGMLLRRTGNGVPD
jgi:hypothetical protein